MEYLWPAQAGCPSHVPSQLLVHPSPSAGGAARDTEEALRLCEHCSARNEKMVSCQQWFGHKSKAQHHTSYYEENFISAKTSTVILKEETLLGCLESRFFVF